jgi:adenylate cyclase
VLQPALVDLLLRDPRQLELRGESRNLTVLFSDIKDFTPFAESLPAPELFTALNEYFSLFTGIAIARGAYLDKYLGDGAMAVWGAPVPAERHAAAACLAALELTTQLRQLHWERRGRGAPGPLTRVGINSGDMVVGMVGSTETAHYTVMGDNVVIASRLEGVNKVYGTEILIGEGCYLQASQDIEAREIDLVVLKGKTRPLRIYEVICPAGALRPGDREKLELFARGLALYRERRWREAEGAFANVLALDPKDGPSIVFFERCRRFAAAEPPPGWQGEFIMAEK